jgi:predicted MPP superfamily phosphohydrolase
MPALVYDIYIIPSFVFLISVFFIGIAILIYRLIKLPFKILKYILLKFAYLKNKYINLKTNKSYIEFDIGRRKFISTSSLAISGLVFASTGIGVVRKDNYDITFKDISIQNLPDELKGLKAVLISDIHSGPFMFENEMSRYCDIINNLKTDLIFIPGDLTNTQPKEIIPFCNAFINLKSNYGVHITLGNHDYFGDHEFIYDYLEKNTDFNIYRNTSNILKINNKEILILGLEDTANSGTQKENVIINYLKKTVDKAHSDFSKDKFSKIPKILLCHKPYFFKKIPEYEIDFVLSGHTHGGQIALLNYGGINISIASAVNEYISGHYIYGNSQMYVSRGLGTVGLPIRLNCRPEITVFTFV